MSVVVAIAIGCWSEPAAAYCRTHTCQANGTCVDDGEGCPVGGVPLFWPRACISFSVTEEASPLRFITADAAEVALDLAYRTWTGARCADGQYPSIEVSPGARVACSRVEFNECDKNANIWVFRDEEWPYDDGGLTLAQTWVHFDTRNGEIFDADVEVNTAQHEITTADSARRNQFIAIATHEIGHVLGLDHSPEREATMHRFYSSMNSMSELAEDDVAGLCAIYPADRRVGACDFAPYNGFSTQCGDSKCDDRGCRATNPGRYARHGAWGVALLGLAMAVGLARRRRAGR